MHCSFRGAVFGAVCGAALTVATTSFLSAHFTLKSVKNEPSNVFVHTPNVGDVWVSVAQSRMRV